MPLIQYYAVVTSRQLRWSRYIPFSPWSCMSCGLLRIQMNPARDSSYSGNTCAFYRWVRSFSKTRDKILAFRNIFREIVMYSSRTSRLIDFICCKKRRKRKRKEDTFCVDASGESARWNNSKENIVADHVVHRNVWRRCIFWKLRK